MNKCGAAHCDCGRTSRCWYECPDCGFVELADDWDEAPFCPRCSLCDGDNVRMELRVDHEAFEPPTVGNRVV